MIIFQKIIYISNACDRSMYTLNIFQIIIYISNACHRSMYFQYFNTMNMSKLLILMYIIHIINVLPRAKYIYTEHITILYLRSLLSSESST